MGTKIMVKYVDMNIPYNMPHLHTHMVKGSSANTLLYALHACACVNTPSHMLHLLDTVDVQIFMGINFLGLSYQWFYFLWGEATHEK